MQDANTRAAVKLALDFPIAMGNGATYTELTIRRQKVKDDLEIAAFPTAAEKEVVLFTRLAGVDREVIEEMDKSDYGKFQDLVMGFSKSPA
ncbi:MAG: phage tail assembly protein [Magnetospirillum sp. WYHS-4]